MFRSENGGVNGPLAVSGKPRSKGASASSNDHEHAIFKLLGHVGMECAAVCCRVVVVCRAVCAACAAAPASLACIFTFPPSPGCRSFALPTPLHSPTPAWPAAMSTERKTATPHTDEVRRQQQLQLRAGCTRCLCLSSLCWRLRCLSLCQHEIEMKLPHASELKQKEEPTKTGEGEQISPCLLSRHPLQTQQPPRSPLLAAHLKEAPLPSSPSHSSSRSTSGFASPVLAALLSPSSHSHSPTSAQQKHLSSADLAVGPLANSRNAKRIARLQGSGNQTGNARATDRTITGRCTHTEAGECRGRGNQMDWR